MRSSRELRIFICLFLGIVLSSFAAADTDVLDVVVTEYVSQKIAYDQVFGPLGADPDILTEAVGEAGENRTGLSRTGVNLDDTAIYGVINITNVETLGNATVLAINITLNETQNITNLTLQSAPPYLTGASEVNLSVPWNNPGGVASINVFVPELRADDSVIINYTINGTGVGEPLNFTEEYSFWRVMTGQFVNVTLNVTNSFIDDVQIYDLELTKTPAPYPNVFGGSSYFNYTNLRGEDSGNATIGFSSFSTLYWNASGRTLDQGETRQIIFDSWAPTNLTVNYSNTSDWAMWLQMGNITADFKLNGSVSGIRLTDIEALPSEVRTSVSKDRVNESWYWNASINLTNDAVAPIDYNLTEVTVWATKMDQSQDPGNLSTWINNTERYATDYPFSSGDYANATWELNLPWAQGIDFDNYSIMFNYSFVPIVWADASFLILDNGTQYFVLNETRNVDDGYIFIEEIYVLLGGYLMKVTKHLTPLNLSNQANMYMVNVTLENIGTKQTP